MKTVVTVIIGMIVTALLASASDGNPVIFFLAIIGIIYIIKKMKE